MSEISKYPSSKYPSSRPSSSSKYPSSSSKYPSNSSNEMSDIAIPIAMSGTVLFSISEKNNNHRYSKCGSENNNHGAKRIIKVVN